MPENFEVAHDHVIDYLGIEVECATREYARARMPLMRHHLNGFGVAHGGVICALADAVAGAASNANSPTAVMTMSFAINFIHPGKNGPLVAEARATHTGSHVTNYDVSIVDARGQIVAHAILSCYVTSHSVANANQQDIS